MKVKRIFLLVALAAAVPAVGQNRAALRPGTTEFLKAEDERRYDRAIKDVLAGDFEESYVVRALLAAGRIGDERSVPQVTARLRSGSPRITEMAAFALGEIESAKGADAVIGVLGNLATPQATRARAVEAAGKIAAANPKNEKSKDLARAIIETLNSENEKGPDGNGEVVLMAITAVLRAKPEGGDRAAAAFLGSTDSRIRADAANTLSRLKSPIANDVLRSMLATDRDPIARANAARALGAAADQSAFDTLMTAAADDKDSRVRVSAIRALGSLNNPRAADKLLDRGEKLLAAYKSSRIARPSESGELIEISTVLGRLLTDTRNARALSFLSSLAKLDGGYNSEIAVARFRVAPGIGEDDKSVLSNWRQYSTFAQVIGEFADLKTTDERALKLKAEAPGRLRPLVERLVTDKSAEADHLRPAAPDALRAYARFKTKDLSDFLRRALLSRDLFTRAAAAELLGEQPPSALNVDALKRAFGASLATDVSYNDAQLAMLDTLAKLDPNNLEKTLRSALASPDGLVRAKAVQIIRAANAADGKAYSQLAEAVADDSLRLSRFGGAGTKMGQVLNKDFDYSRAAARRGGTVRAVVKTEKGTFTIGLLPEDAPLTVDNFIKLARSNYFNGLEVHRVVPNFVMQDGDPRGDGNGGPGWSIRCEINMVPFGRGAVGMALSGKDTGGSQWFVTHSPQPHLDGGYTVFGRVDEAGMKVVDNIMRGDKIISVTIVEKTSSRTRQAGWRKTKGK